jgi:hypothetical protein
MSHSQAEVAQLRFPADRSTLIQWGRDAAAANGVNLAGFRAVLIAQNFGVDHGAAGNGVLIVHQNATLCEFGFISHEMGHAFGLPHSFAANPDMEYGDGWDVMSFATTTFQFPIEFRGTQGAATVGLNARNLKALNAVPAGRTWVPATADFSAQITLDPLNQLPIGNHGNLIVEIPASATRPARGNGSLYTVEFRRRTGWDQSIPENAVLVHEVRSNNLSYLHPSAGSRLTNGQQFVTPDPKVFIRVVGVDATLGTATLRVWDIPEGSLRREDSKPRVYLIQNGTKRWVTSPEVLFALGKTWSDVRLVPDGGLSTVPDGPDLNLRQWESLGGFLTSDPDAVLNAPGGLVVFARGTDNAIWHSWQDQINGNWRPWESLGGNWTSGPAAALYQDGRLNVFARGTDNAIWTRWQTTPNGNWSGWDSIGGVLMSDPAAVLNAAGGLAVFARGTDNAIWHIWQNQINGNWRPWQSLGGNLTGGPAAALYRDGRLNVFARGTDNAIWTRWQTTPNGNWSGWASLGGVLTSDPVATLNAPGGLAVFARGTDNAIWHTWQDQINGNWRLWESLGGNWTSGPAAALYRDGRLNVFARGTDNAIWTRWQTTPNGNWFQIVE